MKEIVEDLNLHWEIREALLNPHQCRTLAGTFLRLVLAYDEAKWERVSQAAGMLKISSSDVATFYMEAWGWVDALMAGVPG